MIIQQYIESQTFRVVASQEKALYAYQKVSDTPLASISQGAKIIYVDMNEDLSTLACQSVKAVGGDLLGVDILFDGQQYYVLEVNTGFAIYHKDKPTHPILGKEFMNIVKKKNNCV